MNITEKAINNLIKYYSLSNAAQLANKFEITQGVVSNWKSRNAIGALTDTVANKDPEALEYIFSSNINNFQNSNNKVSGFGALIDNSNNKSNTTNKKEENNIPQSITIELNSLFERLKEKDEKFIKNITYKIEDFISDIKKETRD